MGIKTGWEITQDIREQVKEASGEELPEGIGYDELLGALAKTSTERNNILRGYFEPNESEREAGIKLPSRAHRAIAQLVKDGYIKVILTTNFDRLMETALEDIHITPDVIRSDDMIKGAPPVRHSSVMVIQLHGDYRDVRTLNTADELEHYSSEKNTFLDEILKDYGLIVCGWSARWDTALRDAIYRVTQRWYSTYWIEPHLLSEEAKELIHHRNAEVIEAKGDDFFEDLQGKVEALAKLNREHPLTVAIAVERVKKLIASDARIELEDLVLSEGKRAYDKFMSMPLRPTPKVTTEIHSFYETSISETLAVTEVVLNLAVAVCWYSDGRYGEMLTALLHIWGSSENGNHDHTNLRKIAPLLLLYSGGMASLYRSNWSCFRALIIDPKLRTHGARDRLTVFDEVHKHRIINYQSGVFDLDFSDPASQIIRQSLRKIFRDYLHFDEDFYELFDLFEMVLAVMSRKYGRLWISHDAALERYAEYDKYGHIFEFWRNGAKKGNDWGFLKECFEGDRNALEDALTQYREIAVKAQRWSPPHGIPDYAALYNEFFPEN